MVGVNDQAPVPVDDAVVVPIWVAPSNIKTVEDSSAVPDIGGLLLVVLVLLAGLVIVGLAGATESTFHEMLSGDVSVFPAVSIALTWKVCVPSASDDSFTGESQLSNTAESREHSKPDNPLLSDPENTTVTFFDAVTSSDAKTLPLPSVTVAIEVFGGEVSGGCVIPDSIASCFTSSTN